MTIKDINKEKRKEDLFTWAHELKDKKISKDKKIYDLFEYNGTNLWRFIVTGICQKILGYEKKRETSQPNILFTTNIFHKVQPVADLLGRALSNTVYKTYKYKGENPVILTTIDRYWKKTYDFSEKKKKYTDEFFDSIIKKLKKENKDFLTIGESNILRDFSTTPISKIISRRIKRKDIPYKSLASFWNLSVLKEEKKAKKHFIKTWKEIQENQKFKECFKYKDENIFEYLEPFLKYLFFTVLSRKIKMIELSKNFIEKTKPSIIVMQNESAGWEQTLIQVARESGIKTLALQHGVIYKLHEGYFHIKGETTNAPIPDITLVYGPETKRILVKENGYPEDKVKAIGQPRYDKIKYYKSPEVKNNFYKKHGIGEKEKIFLLATQPILKELRIKLLKYLIETLDGIKGLRLVVKMHPSEKDISIYQNIIKSTESNAILLPGSEDIFESIASSEFFSTFSSTVALEAMMFKKPVFILNLFGYEQTLPWIKEEAAIEIKEVIQGRKKIIEILQDSKKLKSLLNREEKFLKKHYHKTDGNATERLYNLIKEKS